MLELTTPRKRPNTAPAIPSPSHPLDDVDKFEPPQLHPKTNPALGFLPDPATNDTGLQSSSVQELLLFDSKFSRQLRDRTTTTVERTMTEQADETRGWNAKSGEKRVIVHKVLPSDTLAGVALFYGIASLVFCLCESIHILGSSLMSDLYPCRLTDFDFEKGQQALVQRLHPHACRALHPAGRVRCPTRRRDGHRGRPSFARHHREKTAHIWHLFERLRYSKHIVVRPTTQQQHWRCPRGYIACVDHASGGSRRPPSTKHNLDTSIPKPAPLKLVTLNRLHTIPNILFPTRPVLLSDHPYHHDRHHGFDTNPPRRTIFLFSTHPKLRHYQAPQHAYATFLIPFVRHIIDAPVRRVLVAIIGDLDIVGGIVIEAQEARNDEPEPGIRGLRYGNDHGAAGYVRDTGVQDAEEERGWGWGWEEGAE
ncbi:hypothetical protein BC938DRAFT_479355 [Jimgerdemannia flammicorona]|uniref:Uncharacterized protein n=1 Tax=Jimgerdemannia flammicorona TaxID=994334 RepID=A0A433QXU5_9FUNG|nr:hypothetical protein BC938DRAFT_479355 [Jimgerdemannia flammicorona]